MLLFSCKRVFFTFICVIITQIGGAEMPKKRVQVSMSEEHYDILDSMAKRYGMTTNSIIVFILGQYIDEHLESHEKMSAAVDDLLKSKDDVLNNPELLQMVKEILSGDKDFKDSIQDSLKDGEQ